MIPDYAGCETCPLRDRPPVLGKGLPYGIVVIGEAPGLTEVAQKSPFVGQSGQILRQTLRALGEDPENIYITNTVLCHPEGNATPSKAAIQCCKQRLYDELRSVTLGDSKILLLGGTALGAMTPSTSIMKTRGLGMMLDLGEREVFAISTYHPAAVLRNDDLFRDFQSDIAKLVANSGPIPAPVVTTVICSTVEEAIAELEYISGAPVLSCDLETTGLSPIKDQILSIGFGAVVEGGTGYSVIIPIAIAEQVKPEIRHLIDTVQRLAFHNIKFDIQFLMMWYQDLRLQPRDPIDTMLLQYAQDERGSDDESGSGGRGYATRGLKDQARLRYDYPDYHFDWKAFYALPDEEKPWTELYMYQGMDCYFTAKLVEDLEPELAGESPKLLPMVYGILVPVALALARVELHGAPIDRAYLEGLRLQVMEKLATMIEELRRVALTVGLENFNPNSPIQVKKLLAGIGFRPASTEKEAMLLEMKAKPPYPDEVLATVKLLLEYRQRSKVLGTYIDGMLERLDDDDCVRPDFLPHGTPTGRLACRGPNLQNIPTLMGPDIRNAFIARQGYTFINADYSQLELRVAAWYSRDENLTRAFLENKDVHRWVAALMFKKPEDQITKLERYLAKYLDFGLIYGRGAKGITEGWEAEYIVEMGGERWTLKEAEALTKSFFDAFPKLRGFIERQHQFVRATHYVDTPTGRRRRFPMLTNRTVGSVERKAVNTPIQSLASDMTLRSIIELDRRLPEGAFIISTVHDSIMFEVRDDLVDDVVEMIKSIMSVPCVPEFDVPLRADVEIGIRWGMLKD